MEAKLFWGSSGGGKAGESGRNPSSPSANSMKKQGGGESDEMADKVSPVVM
jgi:hypothetical protein